jgi:hypothetical protein
MTRHNGARWTAVALLALLAAACVNEDTDGIVDVRWAVGGANCARVGVSAIEVSLVAGGREVSRVSATCEAGEVAVGGVPGDTYTVQVFGYRLGAETPEFVGQEAGVVVPKGGRVSTGVIFLEEAPGAIDLAWRFESGSLCRFEGAEWVRITVFDERGRLVTDRELPCDPGAQVNAGLGGPGFEYLEEARGVALEYLFAGEHEVFVLAYEDPSDERATWAGAGSADVTSFALTPLEVVLAPCTDDPDSICF